jgi:hypothetical protein
MSGNPAIFLPTSMLKQEFWKSGMLDKNFEIEHAQNSYLATFLLGGTCCTDTSSFSFE